MQSECAMDTSSLNEANTDLQRSEDTDAKSDAVCVRTADLKSLNYNMSHKSRGRCIIFNHKTFMPNTKQTDRIGTDIDGESLSHIFGILKFSVEQHHNLTFSEISSILSKASEMDYSDTDCIACCVLTHGEQSSACQGNKFDAGVKVISCSNVADSDASYNFLSLPDFLIAQSTVPGYYAWRNTFDGSWFIQALVNTIKKYHNEMDLLSMLTIVNLKVAYYFESHNPNNAEFDKKKQVPCVKTMLTRRIFFEPLGLKS
ncbi:caspase-like protein, partial [Leptotrombidium deliense]